jgi:hypothetical protein
MNLKLNLMYRPFLKILIFTVSLTVVAVVAGVLFYKSTLKKSDCFFADQNLKDNIFFANIRGVEIDIVGWYHGRAERDLAQLAMAEAFKFAKAGDCHLSLEKIESALNRLIDQKKESLRVLNELNNIYEKRHFKSIGVEYGPDQYKAEFDDPDTRQDLSTEFISIFKNLCPAATQQLSELYLIFPGPEYKFIIDNKKAIKIVPLGSDELIQKSLSNYSSESQRFVQQINLLSADGQKAYEQFIELFKAGRPLTKSQIFDLTARLQEPEKFKVQKYFEEASDVLNFLEVRDQSFIENALNANSSMAIVIGNLHVAGLRRELQLKCNALK